MSERALPGSFAVIVAAGIFGAATGFGFGIQSQSRPQTPQTEGLVDRVGRLELVINCLRASLNEVREEQEACKIARYCNPGTLEVTDGWASERVPLKVRKVT